MKLDTPHFEPGHPSHKPITDPRGRRLVEALVELHLSFERAIAAPRVVGIPPVTPSSSSHTRDGIQKLVGK